MPRPQRPWFRFYVETIYDRKLRAISPEQRWLWVAILCITRASDLHASCMIGARAATIADFADAAALTSRTVRRGIKYFIEQGMLVRDETHDCLVVCHWADRQFESDDVTERTRRHRSQEQKGNVPLSFDGTFPERTRDRDRVKELNITSTDTSRRGVCPS